jgi:hypothetical protein
MASVTGLIVVIAIVVFCVGAVFGVIFIVATGIRAEEAVARRRGLERRGRGTTLYDEPTSTMTRGVRRLTGAGHDSGADHSGSGSD